MQFREQLNMLISSKNAGKDIDRLWMSFYENVLMTVNMNKVMP